MALFSDHYTFVIILLFSLEYCTAVPVLPMVSREDKVSVRNDSSWESNPSRRERTPAVMSSDGSGDSAPRSRAGHSQDASVLF